MAREYAQTGYTKGKDSNWMNDVFDCSQKVKFDLFNRYGWIAAAGDRHLAEFCEGAWYLSSPERVKEMGFSLTPVSWRKQDLKDRLRETADVLSGKLPVGLFGTDEEVCTYPNGTLQGRYGTTNHDDETHQKLH
jgi:alpha-galactosidase